MNPVHADNRFLCSAASVRSEVWAALRRESFRAVAAGLQWDGRPDVPLRVGGPRRGRPSPALQPKVRLERSARAGGKAVLGGGEEVRRSQA